MESFLKIATLDEHQVAELRELEQALGVQMMAFEPGPRVAALSEAELQQVRELEERLNVTLLAFEG